jgi:hypothetical protein
MGSPNRLAPHRGGLVLALGILSLVSCPLLGLVSWILGRADLAEMDAGRMDPMGRGSTEAGKVLGVVSLALTALMLMATLVFAAAAVAITVVSGH